MRNLKGLQRFLGKADYKGLAGGRFRPKPGKTRCSSARTGAEGRGAIGAAREWTKICWSGGQDFAGIGSDLTRHVCRLRAISKGAVLWFAGCAACVQHYGSGVVSFLVGHSLLREVGGAAGASTRGRRGADVLRVSGFLITTLLLRERDRFGQISLRDFAFLDRLRTNFQSPRQNPTGKVVARR